MNKKLWKLGIEKKGWGNYGCVWYNVLLPTCLCGLIPIQLKWIWKSVREEGVDISWHIFWLSGVKQGETKATTRLYIHLHGKYKEAQKKNLRVRPEIF